MSIRSFKDLREEMEKADRPTSSFAGGEHSALAVENPTGDFNSAVVGIPPPGSRRVVLYSNGFIIGDGPFRPLGVEQNDKFIQELKAGYAPRELQESGGDVHIGLEDRRPETYQVPTPQMELFSGSGHALASDSVSSRGAGNIDPNRANISIENSIPVTVISFRFYNGQRVAQNFNETHTISDLHNYIASVAPVDGEYILLSGFPPREITVPLNTTLKDAGLLNAAIVQRLK